MRREEILKMEAGPELNRMIAERVLGWKAWEEIRGEYTHVVWQKDGERDPWKGSRDWEIQKERYTPLIKFDPMKHIEHGLIDFSQDISSAWQVVEKLNDLGWQIELADMRKSPDDPGWWVELCRYEPIEDENAPIEMQGKPFATHYWMYDCSAPTVELAICRAALLAVEPRREEERER